MEAISGRVTKIRTMSNGSPRIEIELDCSLADAAALFDVGAEAALARLAAKPAQEPETVKPKGGPLAELAGQWCKSFVFQDWLYEVHDITQSEENAKAWICGKCGIQSRAELDHNMNAQLAFHTAIRKPFMKWQEDVG